MTAPQDATADLSADEIRTYSTADQSARVKAMVRDNPDGETLARVVTDAEVLHEVLAPLLADLDALRRERDDARCVGEALSRAADANLEAVEPAEARVEDLTADLARAREELEPFALSGASLAEFPPPELVAGNLYVAVKREGVPGWRYQAINALVSDLHVARAANQGGGDAA